MEDKIVLCVSPTTYIWYLTEEHTIKSMTLLIDLVKFNASQASIELGDNKVGYYITNHRTKRGKYLGNDWNIAAKQAAELYPNYVEILN